MIDIPTIFILGAGASKPYGYPVGTELRAEIIRDFSRLFEYILGNSSSMQPSEKERHLRQANYFVEKFAASPIDSIDRYLSINPDFEYYGKIAITICILMREKNYNFRDQMIQPYYNEDWFRLLFNRMVTTFKGPQDYEKFRDNKIAFITFNYDRSLEYFLYNGFYNSFYQNRNNFEHTMDEFIPFPIVHIYGQVNKLSPIEWSQSNDYGQDFLSYKMIEDFSKGITVVGERTKEDLKETLSKLIADFKRIFFLGFSYAEENMEGIGLIDMFDKTHRIYGSAIEMTDTEIAYVMSRLSGKSKDGKSIKTRTSVLNKNSYNLLREYL